ncbi:MAG: AmmeMemoRadiSam system protein B [Anaerolineae bacterium]|nr:AmmeMemoRadiSam system protein B [Anaerolineae bacterium]
MLARDASVAGMFYPADASTCQQEIQQYLRMAAVPEGMGHVLGGLVPHAGWRYSGPTAAHLFAAVDSAPETVVLFGAIHRWGVPAPSVYPDGSWRTPLGDCPIDAELADATLAIPGTPIVASRQAHAGEHSIEVQLPFVQQAFPQARILPVAMPPASQAIRAGHDLAEAAQSLGRSVLVIASSDLTHYGPRYGFSPAGVGEKALAWAKANDQRLLDEVLAMDAPDVLQVAAEGRSACGPGAIAATIACVTDLGASRGVLLQHTTSHDVMPMGRPSDFVGYAAVAFVA